LKRINRAPSNQFDISLKLNRDIEDFAFSADRSPQIKHAAIDLQIKLVQSPSRVGPSSAPVTFSSSKILPLIKRATSDAATVSDIRIPD
jgi:hypothetical protein